MPIFIRKPYISKDIAYLTSIRLTDLSGIEVNTSTLTPFQDAYIFGYPANVPEVDQKMVKIGRPVKSRLRSFIPSGNLSGFMQRNSPDLNLSVIRINGPVVSGHSGGPITNLQNQLIGMISGGITEGVQTSWGIALDDLDMESPTNTSTQNILRIIETQANLKQLFDVKEEFDYKTWFTGILPSSATVYYGGAPYCSYSVKYTDIRMNIKLSSDRTIVNEANLSVVVNENALEGCPYQAIAPHTDKFRLERGRINGNSVFITFTPQSTNSPQCSFSFSGLVKDNTIYGTLISQRNDVASSTNLKFTVKMDVNLE